MRAQILATPVGSVSFPNCAGMEHSWVVCPFASIESVFMWHALQGVRPLEGEQLGPGETREPWLFVAAGP